MTEFLTSLSYSMVVKARIDAAAHIIPLYSTGGASVRPYLKHGFLGPRELAAERHLDRFSRFAQLLVVKA